MAEDHSAVADIGGSGEYRWTDGDTAWIERDGRFVVVEAGGQSFALEALDSEQLGLKSPAASCDRSTCTKRFPPSFTHCPDCGSKLQTEVSASSDLWSFPGADGDGLLNTERVNIEKVSAPSTETYPVPDAPNLILVVAGSPRRLLAVDREHSVVYAFNRQEKAWRTFSSDVHFDLALPKWSWTLPAFNGGVALVTEGGPAVAALDSLGRELVVYLPQLGAGRCLAGPAQYEGGLLFLCASGSKLTVVQYDPRSGLWDTPFEADYPHNLAPDEVFAAPVAEKRGDRVDTLYWAGQRGYLALHVAKPLEIKWRDWPLGFMPELGLRPMRVSNALWQFGSTAGQLQFVKIAYRSEQVQKDVEATHLTAGDCSYTSGMRVYTTPWEEAQAQRFSDGDSFYMPLCGLAGISAVVADCGFDINNRRFNPGELLQESAIPRPARLRIHRRGEPPVDLARTPLVASLYQLQAIVFDGNLLVYDSAVNLISSWEILSGKNGRG